MKDKSKDKISWLPVKRVCRPNGSIACIDTNNRQVAVVFRHPMEKKFENSDVIDLRPNPPFLPMSPCPYCNALHDRGHDPLSHVDHRFGVKV